MKPNNNTLLIAATIAVFLIIFFLVNNTSKLNGKVEEAQSKAKEHEIKAKFYKDIYDIQIAKDAVLQSSYDSLVLEKNKIKIKYNEKIKLVDKYSVSDMQYYFNQRTK